MHGYKVKREDKINFAAVKSEKQVIPGSLLCGCSYMGKKV